MAEEMSAPKQEEFDLLNVITVSALLLSLVAGAMLAISGERGKLHLLLKYDGVATIGQTIQTSKNETRYRFSGLDGRIREATRYDPDPTARPSRPGTPIKVFYVRSDPDQFAAEFELPGLEINFNISAGAITVALLSILACTFAWIRRYRLREKLKRY